MADPRTSLLVRFQAPGGRDVMVVPCPVDLRFATVWPGGHKDMSCTVTLPAGSAVPGAMSKLARVQVVDRRTGRTVWAGRLTDPGLSKTAAGLSFALTAEGHQSEADGWREVYAVIDRAAESWQSVGEFSGTSGSFSGDLTPDDSYTVDPGAFGDLTDFGGDLSSDFGGGTDFGGNIDLNDLDLGGFDPGGIDLGDFGGDLGDFGTIDFGGADYPAAADYPGYLGYLQDPTGDFGDMLPIPLNMPAGDGNWWLHWVPGYTSSGATATGTTFGVLTVSAEGGISRHRDGIPDLQGPGRDTSGYMTRPPGTQSVIQQVLATFRLGSASSVLRLWVWADTTLTMSGYYFEVTTSLVGLYRVDDGVTSLLINTPVAITPGVTCTADIDPGVAVQTLVARIDDGSTATTLTYDVTGGPYWEQAGTYWGVSAIGPSGATVEFDQIVGTSPD